MSVATATKTLRVDPNFNLLALHRQWPERYPHLLESGGGGLQDNSQFDILFAYPGEQLELWSNGLKANTDRFQQKTDFLQTFNQWFIEEKVNTALTPAHELPFSGGWFIYLGYEVAAFIENTALDIPLPEDMPIAFATRFQHAIIRHRQTPDILYILSEVADVAKQNAMLNDIEFITQHVDEQESILNVQSIREEDPAIYIDGVNKIKNYILEGDIFQVNLSRQWIIELGGNVSAADIYANLRLSNPAPFSGLLTHPAFSLASSSPERLVSVNNHHVQTRPIAGTRPRHKNSEQDQALLNELIQHPKERAEHIMLIDLERNDLGRICQPGTVNVNELMVVESFEHVHHIVSNVEGQLQDNANPVDTIKAVFPGGTITGCPKVRCMQILAELEQKPRCSYTGSMGYINSTGDMDVNILIRGILVQGRTLTINAGGGIVADSIPEKEVAETRSKAKGMLKAMGIKINVEGLLETFRVANNSIPLWQYHKERLLKGLQYYHIAESEIDKIEQQVCEVINQTACYRLLVTIEQHHIQDIILLKHPSVDQLDSQLIWRTKLCETALPEQPIQGIKLLQRDDYDKARQTLQQYDEGLLQNSKGDIIEGTVSNIFGVKNNRLYTPVLDDSGVNGSMRRYIIDFCQKTNLPCTEINMSAASLYDYDEMFACNAIRGIIPIIEVQGTLFKVGSITKQLQRHIESIFTEDDD